MSMYWLDKHVAPQTQNPNTPKVCSKHSLDDL